ncbi:XRE family transcriptional regulator [Clostridium sp. MCC334]|nr:XRE family transcriptional regulator [Clostridium sp. MCC334]
MNKNQLRSVMALHGDNDGMLAEYLGISKSRFSAKINETGGAEFNQGEILKIKHKYNLSAEEVDLIFFS